MKEPDLTVSMVRFPLFQIGRVLRCSLAVGRTPVAPAPYTGPDHGFGDDNALANEIASFDPLADTNGSAAESRQVLSRTKFVPTVETLAPEMRPAILQQLGGLSGEAKTQREAELVTQAMAQLALDARVKQGGDVGTNAYQIEKFEQANRLRQLDEEQKRISADLEVFDGYKTGAIDPSTGQPAAEKIYRYQGDKRTALINRLVEIGQIASHIEGAEGTRRLRKALEQAVTDTKKERDRVSIMHEAKARAAHIVREEQIDQQAAGFAKSLRGNFG